mmetsp:Transcript_18385/g.57290  ORF Transcript_18385/g.57290 Transcript_18385/m.57290 type:complete len:505 (+) Transcript_18385:99-1613(+)
MSLALLSASIRLYSADAFASAVAMKRVPMYAKSAPIASAPSTELPSAIAPDSAIGPAKTARSSRTSANGESVPACPPAPAQTGMRPSTPYSIAFCACRSEITSCSTFPPYECTASMTSLETCSDVITMGTRCSTQMARSVRSRLFEAWQIWLTANGAGRLPAASAVASSALIRSIHAVSSSGVRALSAGNEPTMPALHCSMTSSGHETMKSGEPITGSLRRCWKSRKPPDMHAASHDGRPSRRFGTNDDLIRSVKAGSPAWERRGQDHAAAANAGNVQRARSEGRTRSLSLRNKIDNLVGVPQDGVRAARTQLVAVRLEVEVRRHDTDRVHARRSRGDHIVARVADVHGARRLDGLAEQAHGLGEREGVGLALALLRLHRDHDREESVPAEPLQRPACLRVRPARDERHRVARLCKRAQRLGAVDDGRLARNEPVKIGPLVPQLERLDHLIVRHGHAGLGDDCRGELPVVVVAAHVLEALDGTGIGRLAREGRGRLLYRETVRA